MDGVGLLESLEQKLIEASCFDNMAKNNVAT